MAAEMAAQWWAEWDGQCFEWGSTVEWDDHLSAAYFVTTVESWSAEYLRAFEFVGL
jgi:hypothetical protein